MDLLYTSSDYRDFLRAHYEMTKERVPHYSYRYICSKMGFKSSYLARLFNKETHLSPERIASFAELMKLSVHETEWFDLLVRLGRAKSDDEREPIIAQMDRIRGIAYTRIQQDQESFFAQTHHMTIRSLLGITPLTAKDFRRIGSMTIPLLSIQEVRESVELLQRLGMVTIDENGVYRVTDTYISTKEKWSSDAIHTYQLRNIDLSREALEQLPKEIRDISTVTFTIDRNRMDELRLKLQRFRDDMFRFSEECTNDTLVMHLNLQLFPTADVTKG